MKLKSYKKIQFYYVDNMKLNIKKKGFNTKYRIKGRI